eukprot:TRINITY_DN60074_c0_g1_i1.p1 TRINITY_DN60074_c0_g1~~TRINITY_DN60074_c0_g1_i1.p1  ORF type:complete len:894 (-),score=172.28 TRINITY_DN60074_c0_g1_i1:13-2694(-)
MPQQHDDGAGSRGVLPRALPGLPRILEPDADLWNAAIRSAEAAKLSRRLEQSSKTLTSSRSSEWSQETPSQRRTRLKVSLEEFEQTLNVADLPDLDGDVNALAVYRELQVRRGFRLWCLLIAYDRRFYYFRVSTMTLYTVFLAIHAHMQINASNLSDAERTMALQICACIDVVFWGFLCCELILRGIGSPVPVWKLESFLLDVLTAVTWLVEMLGFAAGLSRVSAFGMAITMVSQTLRLVRTLRALSYAKIEYGVNTTLVALGASIEPLLCVLVCLVIFLGLFAIGMTAVLGPSSGLSAQQMGEAVLSDWKSVPVSAVSLLELLCHGREWGPEQLHPLFDVMGTTEDARLYLTTGTGAFLLTMYACFGHFGTALLFGGIFMEVMTSTMKREAKEARMMEISGGSERADQMRVLLREYGGEDGNLTLDEVTKCFISDPDFWLTQGASPASLKATFNAVDVKARGVVQVDHLVSSIISGSSELQNLDMVILEYNQNKCSADLAVLESACEVDRAGLKKLCRGLLRQTQDVIKQCPKGEMIEEIVYDLFSGQQNRHSSVALAPNQQFLFNRGATFDLRVHLHGAIGLTKKASIAGHPRGDVAFHSSVMFFIVGRREETQCTKVVENSFNPVWDHEATIRDFSMEDTLEFCVYHDDNAGEEEDSTDQAEEQAGEQGQSIGRFRTSNMSYEAGWKVFENAMISKREFLGLARLRGERILPMGFRGLLQMQGGEADLDMQRQPTLRLSIEVRQGGGSYCSSDTISPRDTSRGSRDNRMSTMSRLTSGSGSSTMLRSASARCASRTTSRDAGLVDAAGPGQGDARDAPRTAAPWANLLEQQARPAFQTGIRSMLQNRAGRPGSNGLGNSPDGTPGGSPSREPAPLRPPDGGIPERTLMWT